MRLGRPLLRVIPGQVRCSLRALRLAASFSTGTLVPHRERRECDFGAWIGLWTRTEQRVVLMPAVPLTGHACWLPCARKKPAAARTSDASSRLGSRATRNRPGSVSPMAISSLSSADRHGDALAIVGTHHHWRRQRRRQETESVCGLGEAAVAEADVSEAFCNALFALSGKGGEGQRKATIAPQHAPDLAQASRSR